MDIETLKSTYIKLENKPKRTMEELIAEALAIDRSKKYIRKTPTKAEKQAEELKAMLEYEKKEPVIEEVSPYKQLVKDENSEWDVKIGDKIEYFDPTLSYELTGYRPITKTQGLDFNPKDFTKAADTYRQYHKYTQLIPGTFRHIKHWDVEWDRCLNGMTVGKYRITGENYFWLNYYRLQSPISQDGQDELRNEDFPGFINKQYEYFHYLELVRKLKRDGLAFKSRGVNKTALL